ncbi:hypothetical protein HHK36_020526 [Tetracentron sinense]|uniref:40S ribosomal protein S15 n=1 Tax=Tetracentron sinense TaxID=13715 RepID=A0A834YRV4_TETSI|nr:hypothetical protein HHK36_020526 [Tetracentron sinense]
MSRVLDDLKQKREAPPGEKPEPVRTHLRNMIIVPEMIGSIIGVYNGKTFNQVEIKPEMIGHYLAEFSISYKPVKHGRPGIGATHSSRCWNARTMKSDNHVCCFSDVRVAPNELVKLSDAKVLSSLAAGLHHDTQVHCSAMYRTCKYRLGELATVASRGTY